MKKMACEKKIRAYEIHGGAAARASPVTEVRTVAYDSIQRMS